MSLLAKLRFFPTSFALRLRIASARKLLGGEFCWHAFAALGIPGFGTELIRLDFPPDLTIAPDWAPVRAQLALILNQGRTVQLSLLDACLTRAGDLRSWPDHPDSERPSAPWLKNEFLTELDMAILYGMLLHVRPDCYLEVGSGISTRIAAMARQTSGANIRIVSIDPQPRVEVAQICDEMHRRRLEESVEDVLAGISPKSILFFDGSHRSFPGSDVTMFFLSLLPRLPRGVIVHIHDIYLPDDYPPNFRSRFWSEQYLLAAWLLGGSRKIRVLLPAAMLAQDDQARACLRQRLSPVPAGSSHLGSSFWFEIAD